MFCGIVCLFFAILSMEITLLLVPTSVTLFTLALVFGVLAVVERKPIQGLALILFVAISGSLLCFSLLVQRANEQIKQINTAQKSFDDAMRKLIPNNVTQPPPP